MKIDVSAEALLERVAILEAILTTLSQHLCYFSAQEVELPTLIGDDKTTKEVNVLPSVHDLIHGYLESWHPVETLEGRLKRLGFDI